eukprot:765845-Hanusia_phi.AAC.1
MDSLLSLLSFRLLLFGWKQGMREPGEGERRMGRRGRRGRQERRGRREGKGRRGRRGRKQEGKQKARRGDKEGTSRMQLAYKAQEALSRARRLLVFRPVQLFYPLDHGPYLFHSACML